MNTPTASRAVATPRDLAAFIQSHETWRQSPDSLTRLTRRLATTLCLERQLSILAEEISSVIPFEAMNYRHHIVSRDFVYIEGKGGPHRCEYRLNLEGENFGTLSLHRRKKFSERELEALEIILGVAICNIRNACQYQAVQQTALTDGLTNIPNRRAFTDDLENSAQIGDRHDQKYTLILVDLDHFKAINDTHGHVVGDHVLKMAAKEIRRAIRNSDTAYRIGGEEFAVILPHTDDRNGQRVADRIRQCLSTIAVKCGNQTVSVTASCGVAMRVCGESGEQWQTRADNALYEAKNAGRNCTKLFASVA